MKKKPVKPVKKEMEKVEPMPPDIVKLIIENYNTALDQQMEHLHSRLIAYVSESKLPVMQVIMVLQILLSEATEIATKKYVKGD